MIRIKGFGMAYDKDDSLVDIVIERTERYFNKYQLLPEIAYVWQGITDEEIQAFMDYVKTEAAQIKKKVIEDDKEVLKDGQDLGRPGR